MRSKDFLFCSRAVLAGSASFILCISLLYLLRSPASYLPSVSLASGRVNQIDASDFGRKTHDWEPDIICPQKRHSHPVESFFFYALHKTGSTKIRSVLNNYCDRHHLKCFAPEMNYKHCDKSGTACRRRIQPLVDIGTSTFERIKSCCPGAFRDKFDAIFGHALMNDPQTASWVWGAFKKATPFTMTFIRDPVDVFESYFHNLPYYQDMHGMPLSQLADLLLDARSGRIKFGGGKYTYNGSIACLRIKDEDYKWERILANSQSKEMGWDGESEDSFRRLLVHVSSLDFVGVTEHMAEGLGSLELKLGWPHTAMEKIGPINMTVYHHDPAVKYKILLVQDKDRRLHRFAKKVYIKCHAFAV